MDAELQIITGAAGLLSAVDMASLVALRAELVQTWETAQQFRTRTEMEVSVLNDVKHPTPDSKYWQAVREQDVFVGELTALSFEYRKNAVEQRKLARQIAANDDDLEREALQIEAERLAWVAANMRRVAAHRLREIQEWSRIKAELEPWLQYGTNDVDAHQLEAFQQRFSAEASLVTEHTPIADARNVLGLALAAQRQAARR
jgi:hypothetical protein